MPINIVRHTSRVTATYMTVADLRQVLAVLPDDAAVLTFDEETGEFYPYPWPNEFGIQTYGAFPTLPGFTYIDLVRPGDRNQPDATQEFDGLTI